MSLQVKLIYKTETKKIKRPTSYQSLCEFSIRSFGTLPPSFKYFYFDSDNDLITLSNEDDLEEALASETHLLKIYIDEDLQKVKETIKMNASSIRDSA